MTVRKSLGGFRGKAVFLKFLGVVVYAVPLPKPVIRKRPGKKAKTVDLSRRRLAGYRRQRQTFLQEFNVSYPNGRDESGKIAVDYGTWGIPESFFIDPQGRITYKHVGAIRAGLVLTKLDEAAKGIASAEEGRGDYQGAR